MTFLALKLFALNVLGMIQAGLQWALVNWRIILGVFLIIFVFAFVLRQCNRPPKVKIDEAQIQKINSENRAERVKELTEIVEANEEVIKTVDERTELVDVAAEARNQEVDARVKKADEAIQSAKKEGKDVTAEELEALLLGGK